MKSISVKPKTDADFITVRTPIQLHVAFWSFVDDCNLNVNVVLYTQSFECVFNIGYPTIKAEKGVLVLKTTIPSNFLNNLTYSVTLTVIKNNSTFVYEFPNCATFEVEDVRENMNYFGKWPGITRPKLVSSFKVEETVIYQ